MIDFITEQLQNQFLSGGMVLMLIGATLALLRRVPGQLYGLLYRRLVTTVDVSDQDESFYWLQVWLSEHPYSKKSRLLTVSTRKVGFGHEKIATPGDEEEKHGPEIYFTPAPGLHLLQFEGRWVLVSRERKEAAAAHSNQYWREVLTLRTFVRDRDFLRRMVYEARRVAAPPGEKRVTICTIQYDHWRTTSSRPPRNPDSVILVDGLMESILEEVERFFASRDWYGSLGIPYRMGYLLYGPPGSGKTSLVTALASHFQKSLYIAKASGISDERFRCLMDSVPPRSILLLEDVDSFFREGNPTVVNHSGNVLEPGLTFSGFLNSVDGVSGSEGRLLVMTTNHPNKLADSLVRRGRIDRRIHLGNADESQAERIFLRFFEGEHQLARRFARSAGYGGYSMADLQGHLLDYRNDAESASIIVPKVKLVKEGA